MYCPPIPEPAAAPSLPLFACQCKVAAEVYLQYRDLVFRTAFRLLNDFQEAEDLTQDIFVGLLQRYTYDPARGSLVCFLRTLTRSRAIDLLRSQVSRRRSQQRHGKSLAAESRPCLLEGLSLQERSEQLLEAMDKLPLRWRLVLELAYFGGLSQVQIAAKIGAPLGTVKSWARFGQQHLRRLLADRL
ncbi:sigma-70 family RNA polymerase sigma factor [Gloeobacter morelensis]|uniref:Sigma-70 family RNA polymerase sigma factor n=1 Tax=Gloeobacter morelensis MG652769 TaxID=2781736 RepID=A0ABY3PNE5_9CYAN|nr:sigma-70 family RNA polymerase sigma factor [Gloeobacter morelensis]UFP95206.1 sigma-70 family RNA polymerase sigma factor [Gloeobacter morelensis MG652769]